MNDEPLRLGVIGCGGFGLFALQQFSQVPGVTLAGMAGTHREAARAAAARFGLPDIVEVDALLERADVDLVYIATPPFLHHPQAMQALGAGKHVICEKPLALDLHQADELIARAAAQDRLVVANLMQRYNPLFGSVGRLIDSGILGDLLHGYFENYASDESLSADHWFWDPEKSGGIFIEHGVHFFDLFAGWLGPPQIESAQRSLRPGTSYEDQVQCTARFGESVLVNFYHGFHQPGRMDRQEMRLVFERGAVTLFEWVPTRVRVHAVADERNTRRLCELFPGAALDVSAVYSTKDRACRGRGKDLDVYQLFDLSDGGGEQKMHVYGRLLRAMLADQLAWIRNRDHQRVITEQNGRDSLAAACAAARLSRTGETAAAANSPNVE